MTAARKFLFDTSFDPGRPEPAESAGAEAEPEPVAPSFSEADLEAARREAQATGREAGAAEAMASVEQRVSESLSSVDARLESLLAEQAAAAETRRAVALRLAIKAIETLFPSLASGTRLAEIEAAIAAALNHLEDEPRVVIRVAGDVVDPLRERLSALSVAAHFDGQLMLLSDDALGPGAVRVEWASGGAERDSAEIWQELRATIEAHLAHLPEMTTQAEGTPPPAADPTAPAGPPASETTGA